MRSPVIGCRFMNFFLRSALAEQSAEEGRPSPVPDTIESLHLNQTSPMARNRPSLYPFDFERSAGAVKNGVISPGDRVIIKSVGQEVLGEHTH